jgi:hypothetical protein
MIDLAREYAHLLNKRDVEQLFAKLEELSGGSRVKAASLCGLERKTTYGWKEAADPRAKTKQKLLNALLKQDPLFLLGFMAQKSAENSAELARTYIVGIYERAMGSVQNDMFTSLLHEFYKAKERFAGTLSAPLREEIAVLTTFLARRASERGVTVPAVSVESVSSTEILTQLPLAMRAMRTQSLSGTDLSRKLGIPIEVLNAVREMAAPSRSYLPYCSGVSDIPAISNFAPYRVIEQPITNIVGRISTGTGANMGYRPVL